MFIEVLVEGGSDVPIVKEILTRRFNLRENIDFKIHPHQGKGDLPASVYSQVDPRNRSLLHQLPAKLRGYSHLSSDYCIIILVDADNDDCIELKRKLVDLHQRLHSQPPCVLFRIAIEEIESWFIADIKAVKAAYPHAKIQKIEGIPPDAVVGAWEHLADTLGRKIEECNGSDKLEWSKKISPHLDLNDPKSTSLFFFIQGVQRLFQSHENQQ
ncbi:MAG: DUF4276 family protein [Methanoregula sp.]|nr:DUF4276 family protein [Methanoregula sp.]